MVFECLLECQRDCVSGTLCQPCLLACLPACLPRVVCDSPRQSVAFVRLCLGRVNHVITPPLCNIIMPGWPGVCLLRLCITDRQIQSSHTVALLASHVTVCKCFTIQCLLQRFSHIVLMSQILSVYAFHATQAP